MEREQLHKPSKTNVWRVTGRSTPPTQKSAATPPVRVLRQRRWHLVPQAAGACWAARLAWASLGARARSVRCSSAGRDRPGDKHLRLRVQPRRIHHPHSGRPDDESGPGALRRRRVRARCGYVAFGVSRLSPPAVYRDRRSGPIRALRDAPLSDALGRPAQKTAHRDCRAKAESSPLENRYVGLMGSPTPTRSSRSRSSGCWDTVDAYGLPIDELTRVVDWFIWPLTMRDLNLERAGKACCGTRAVARRRAQHVPSPPVERRSRTPTTTTKVGDPGGNRDTKHIDDERISQVWFSGVHSKCRRGPPRKVLSFVLLDWYYDRGAKVRPALQPEHLGRVPRFRRRERGQLRFLLHGVGGY